VITLIEIFKAYSILKRNLFYSDNFLIFFVRIGPSETVYWLGGVGGTSSTYHVTRSI
jgi:hypothetical protein